MNIGLGIVEISILLGVFVFCIYGAILHKAGFPRWMSLLLLIPGLNILLVWIFAYSKWPATDSEDAARLS